MSVIIYQFVLLLYQFVARIAALTNEKARLFVDGRKNLLDVVQSKLKSEKRPRIWIHAASLGEYEQALPLIKALKDKYPNHAFIVTFFSPSGLVPIEKKNEHDYVLYMPLDHKTRSLAFIQLLQPDAVFFIKYESWYYYLHYLKQLDIPTFLVSAIFNKKQLVFKWYGGIFRSMLNCYTRIMVQDEQSKMLLASRAILQVSVVGDTRFDRVVDHVSSTHSLQAIDAFKGTSKLFVAGSTWLRDERILVQLQEKISPDWKLIIVPHEVDTKHIQQLKKLFPTALLWSEKNNQEGTILIIDKIGILNNIYASADMAWVGGGFDRDGVHNVIEPAVRNIPVLFGPIYKAYREANLLIEYQLATSCENIEDILSAMNFYNLEFSSSRFKQQSSSFFSREVGATEKIMQLISIKSNQS